jgi:hypothetical protein
MDGSITPRLATSKFVEYISTAMRERDLRESIRRIGVQAQGLEFEGELLDGGKRFAICAELGIHFPVHRATTLAEACSILWTRHPYRAIQLAGRAGANTVLELSHLCSASPVAIAAELQANKPKPPKKASAQRRLIEGQPYPQLKETKKMLRRLFILEPELYAYAQEAAAQCGHGNVNKLVRDALWAKVALLVPQAPQFQPQRVQPPNGARVGTKRRGG